MYDKLNKKSLLYYGWEHNWWEPQNFEFWGLKEYIKGPFAKPKLIRSFPFLTYCQTNCHSSPLNFKHGIPDIWAELQIYKLSFAKQFSQRYESMHKEDVDVVRSLRKHYRLYLGQGIPDPWTTYPNADTLELSQFEGLKTDIKKYILQLLYGKNYKNKEEDSCLCCEKKFLFECPDKTESITYNQDDKIKISCSCQDCHGKDSNSQLQCGENCKCIQILQNWVLEHSSLFKGNIHERNCKKNLRQSGLSSGASYCATDEDFSGENLMEEKKQSAVCTCRPQETNFDSIAENGDSMEKSKHKRLDSDRLNKNFKDNLYRKTRVCFCPYIKKFSFRKKDSQSNNKTSNSNNFRSNDRTSSKQIQTDFHPIKCENYSKCDNLKKSECIKASKKCQCSSKCSGCGIYRCQIVDSNSNSPAGPMVSNLCLSYPQFVCPCSYANHLMLQKHMKHDRLDVKGKRIKKQSKEKESEEDSISDLPDPLKRQEDYEKSKSNGFKVKTDKSKNFYSKGNPKIYYCQPSNTAFDHLRYIANNKLKYNLQEKVFPLEKLKCKFEQNVKPSFVCSEYESAYNGNHMNRFDWDRYRRYSYKMSSKEKYSESSGEENKILSSGKDESLHLKRINAGVQTNMLPTDEKEPKKEILAKDEFSKDVLESDESRTLNFSRNGGGSNAVRKRRKLLGNKKKNRKMSIKKTSVLNKSQKTLDLPCENIKDQKNSEEFKINCFKIYSPSKVGFLNLMENNHGIARTPNFCEKNNLTIFNSRKNFCASQYSNEILSSKKSDMREEFNDKKSDKVTDKFNYCKPTTELDGVFEKISQNSGTSWSSNTLKGIVNDLIDDKQQISNKKKRDVKTGTHN